MNSRLVLATCIGLAITLSPMMAGEQNSTGPQVTISTDGLSGEVVATNGVKIALTFVPTPKATIGSGSEEITLDFAAVREGDKKVILFQIDGQDLALFGSDVGFVILNAGLVGGLSEGYWNDCIAAFQELSIIKDPPPQVQNLMAALN